MNLHSYIVVPFPRNSPVVHRVKGVSLAHAIERAETLHDITFSHDGMAKDGKWRIMSVADYEAEAGDFDDWFKGRQEKASALVREALAEAEKSWKSLEHPMRDDPAAEESDFSERDCGCCHGRKRMFPDDDEDSCPHCHGKGWSKDEYFPTVQGLLSLQRQEWRKAGQPLEESVGVHPAIQFLFDTAVGQSPEDNYEVVQDPHADGVYMVFNHTRKEAHVVYLPGSLSGGKNGDFETADDYLKAVKKYSRRRG